jgi:hypothetical protein
LGAGTFTTLALVLSLTLLSLECFADFNAHLLTGGVECTGTKPHTAFGCCLKLQV